MTARGVAPSLDYRMRKWYDHWLVLLKPRGSVWPRALVTIIFSTVIAFLYWHYVIEHTEPGSVIGNPAVFGFYMQTAGVILAFTTNISYNRYWEALTALSQMSASARWVASMALSFDRENEQTSDSDKWKARVLHILSILHGTCIQSLNRDVGQEPMEVIGGLTEMEAQELSLVSDQPTLVVHWLNEALSERLAEGGLCVKNAPVVSQIWVQVGAFMSSYHNARKIAFYRLPLSFHQSLAWSDLMVAFLTPLCIAAFVPNLTVCLIFCFVTCAGFHGIYLANISMQQPFGHKSCDLPLTQVHKDFINGILSIISMSCANEINSFYLKSASMFQPDDKFSAERFCPIALAPQRTARASRSNFTTADSSECSDISDTHSDLDTVGDGNFEFHKTLPGRLFSKQRMESSISSNEQPQCVVIDEGDRSCRVLATPVMIPANCKGIRKTATFHH